MKKFCFLLLIATLLFSCKQGGQQNKKNDDKPVITVTIEPLRYFTEAIAGDEFTVVSMVPKGSSPETYDPTPQQLVDLAQSKAYFRIGYIGFEQTWTEKLTDNAPHLQFFDMSENVELILDDTHAHHHKRRACTRRPYARRWCGTPHLEFHHQRPNHCRKHSECTLRHRQSQ